MKTKWIEEKIDYDGSQLRSLFSYLDHGVLGNSIVSWRGACDVKLDHMIDGEDKRSSSAIRGSDMIHFIVEKFDEKLSTAVALQRLLASIVKDELEVLNSKLVGKLKRRGDDIYFNEKKKLSISVATATPISILIHFAVNISNEGTPVETSSLNDFSIEPLEFARSVLSHFSEEVLSITEATQKVHWAR